jgi:hypothetical protein
MAQEWGITPWQIPDAPVIWVERWRARKLAVSERAELERKKHGYN